MNNRISAKELGIDLTKTYSGSEVEEIINIIFDEADSSIVNAYNEGYKQATLELQPTIDVLNYRLDTYESNSFKSYVTTASLSFGLGILIGGFAGFNIKLKLD